MSQAPPAALQGRSKKVATLEVSSESREGLTYTVALYSDGRLTCDCPHYLYRLARQGRICKHGLKALKFPKSAWSRVSEAPATKD